MVNDEETVKIVRAMLDRMRVKSKSGPINYIAHMTWGIPRGAPSSPVLFNMYIDLLVADAEASECARQNEVEVVMVADCSPTGDNTDRSTVTNIHIHEVIRG